jgi:hypothetical protein
VNDDPTAQTADSYTFLGCMKKLIVWLRDTYGGVPVVLFTPFQRNGGGRNGNGNSLADFADAVKALGRYYSIPVCDLYAESGLSIGTLTDKDAATYQYTSDGLHLLPSAVPLVAPKMAEVMGRAVSAVYAPCVAMRPSNSGAYTLTNTNAQRIYVLRTPDYATDRVEWTSSNESIVKVEPHSNFISANITAVSDGTATVTAKCGGVTTSFDITVSLA